MRQCVWRGLLQGGRTGLEASRNAEAVSIRADASPRVRTMARLETAPAALLAAPETQLGPGSEPESELRSRPTAATSPCARRARTETPECGPPHNESGRREVSLTPPNPEFPSIGLGADTGRRPARLLVYPRAAPGSATAPAYARAADVTKAATTPASSAVRVPVRRRARTGRRERCIEGVLGLEGCGPQRAWIRAHRYPRPVKRVSGGQPESHLSRTRDGRRPGAAPGAVRELGEPQMRYGG